MSADRRHGSTGDVGSDGSGSPWVLRRRANRRRLGLTGLALLLVAAVLTVGVNALYTDNFGVTANDFSTGDLDLTAAPSTAAISYSDMIPGDVVVQSLTVTNGGSTDLRYSMESTTNENLLATQLDFTLKVGVAACTEAGFGGSGTTLYGPDDLGSMTTDPIFGLSATGDDPGDRTLAAAAAETLCLQVALPSGSGNSYQAQTTTAIFTFDAEQTSNNP